MSSMVGNGLHTFDPSGGRHRQIEQGDRGSVRQGSWVSVEGSEGVYVVLYLDQARGVADLLHMEQVRGIVNGVEVSKLRVLDVIP